MATRKRRSPQIAKPEERDKYVRSTLSINDIRGLAWNAVQGSEQSYEILESQYRKLSKIANNRLRLLEKAELDMFAYDRVITYLENQGDSRFSQEFASSNDFKEMVDQMSELVAFVNSKTSTVAGARKALKKKLDTIAEFTGKTYTKEQRQNLGRLLGTDSVSTLLRDIRGNSGEVIEALEDIALTSADSKAVTEIIDRYLLGWQPWDNTLDFLGRSRGMNYDELLDSLRELADQAKENK